MSTFLIIAVIGVLIILYWALSNDKGKSIRDRSDDDNDSEKLLRRRTADKEIEKDLKEEEEQEQSEKKSKKGRRANDKDDDSPEESPQSGDSDTFTLPFSADEIIPETSRSRVYRRTLINSESYAKKGDFTTANSLYQGVKSRINDKDITEKIQANIDYLENYTKYQDETRDRRKTPQNFNQTANEIKFKIDGPIPETIQIGIQNVADSLNPEKIANEVRQKLNDEISQVQQLKNELATLSDNKKNESINNELNTLKNEFRNLNDTLSNNERLEGEIESLKKEFQSISDGNDQEEKSNLTAEREIIDNKIDKLDQKIQKIEAFNSQNIREVDTRPSVIEANYDSPIPSSLNPKPIIDILQNIQNLGSSGQVLEPLEKESEQIVPEDTQRIDLGEIPPVASSENETGQSAPVTSPGKDAGKTTEPSTEIAEKTINEGISKDDEKTISDNSKKLGKESSTEFDDIESIFEEKSTTKEKEIEKEIEPKEDYNEFELLSELGKEEDKSSLTDEDIFEKILEDDSKSSDKLLDDVEILGESKKTELDEYSITDKELAAKEIEDEAFYKNFITSEKRKKKELPILKVTYDFGKLPEPDSLSKEKNIIEYSFYKYRPLLEKAEEFIKKRQVRDAINYYKVVLSQNIPSEFKVMIRKNLKDLYEYLEKYLTMD